jgi:hypothetical protein
MKNRYEKLKKSKPWKLTYFTIRTRCNNSNIIQYKNYGGRGIKCLITEEELKKLWFRDKAYKMQRPSIDRIDNDGNYEYNNCRYIELSLNIAERNKRRNSIIIKQYTLKGKFIKTWPSLREIERVLGFNHCSVGYACNGNYKQSNGFIWRYA